MPAPRDIRDIWRFPTALGAALSFHIILCVTWETLPFAIATEQSPIPDDGLSSLAVQLVAPAPPPVPVPAPPVPEPTAPEPTAPRREAADNMPKRSEGTSQSVRASSEQDNPTPTPKPVITAKEPTVPKAPSVETAPRRKAADNPPKPKPRPASSPVASGPPAPPSYRTNPKPPYPSDARAAHAQGTTYLRVEISTSGSVGRVTIIKSSGHASLDASAVKTVSSRWRFHPARRGRTAVPAVVTVPIRFQLR